MFVWDRLWRTDTSFFGGHLRIPNPMCIIYRSVLYMQSTPCQILNCKLTVTATHYLLVKLPTKRCSNPSSFITILWTDPKRQMQIKTNSHLLHKLLRIAILQTCFLFNFFCHNCWTERRKQARRYLQMHMLFFQQQKVGIPGCMSRSLQGV